MLEDHVISSSASLDNFMLILGYKKMLQISTQKPTKHNIKKRNHTSSHKYRLLKFESNELNRIGHSRWKSINPVRRLSWKCLGMLG